MGSASNFFKAFDELYREPDNSNKKKSPITGEPIPVPGTPKDPPTDDEIDALADRLIKSMSGER